jgi:hypothetical protein
MRLGKFDLSLLALTAANVSPLAGVFFLGWDAATIVLLYWTENLILGFYNILKMVLVRATPPAAHLGKLFDIPFFCLHYGGFCAGHGFFLLIFFKLGGGPEALFKGMNSALGPLVFVQLLINVVRQLWQSRPPGMELPVLCLFASHGVSFVQNFLVRKEYRTLTLDKLMGQPYTRIVLLHVAIIAAGMPVMLLGSPMPLLLILVVLKIGLDIFLHIKSHKVKTQD